MKTIIILIVIFIAVIYYKKTKATRRTRRTLAEDNLFIYPAKEHDMYIIRENNSKDILAIAKDLDNGTREYLVFGEEEDPDKVSMILIDNKHEVLNTCSVDENGNLYCILKEHGFTESADGREINNECHGNIQNHEWFLSKTGNTYQTKSHHLDIPPRP